MNFKKNGKIFSAEIFDEFSFIGMYFLHRIDNKLKAIKGNDKAYGGINVYFTGDFN